MFLSCVLYIAEDVDSQAISDRYQLSRSRKLPPFHSALSRVAVWFYQQPEANSKSIKLPPESQKRKARSSLHARQASEACLLVSYHNPAFTVVNTGQIVCIAATCQHLKGPRLPSFCLVTLHL